MIINRRPDNYQELLEWINQESHYIFAGGTDLMIRKRQWQGAERRFDKPIIYINHLPEFQGISQNDDFYEIGSCVTQSELAASPLLPEYIKEPVGLMATPAIRNVATIGGNVVNNASVGDSIPLLYALDAQLILRCVDGVRTIQIQDFIKGKYKTDLKENEVLEKILLPKYKFDGHYYRKTGLRKASILSKLSVYLLYKKDRDKLVEIRIAIGAVNETPIRLKAVEEKFVRSLDIKVCIDSYLEKMKAENDKRSTKLYREEVVSRLLEKYLEEVVI